ncbi:MAG: ABC transporter ATP-binding protein [Bacteroidota bacterium]
MISIRNIVKKFPTVTALNSVSLEISKGEFFGLLGPNGAGKSTLMNLLAGYENPDSGEISIAGEKTGKDHLSSRKHIGLIPQSLALYDELNAVDNLEIFGSLYLLEKKLLKERISESLTSVGLFDRRKDNVKTFSGGMKRRLNLIASLLHDPPILLCDEPTVGVDPQSRNAIFDYLLRLNENGKTIIYTTHYMEEAERLCSRIGIIDSGTIIAIGSLNELLSQSSHGDKIVIEKTPETNGKMSLFAGYGSVADHNDHIEITPAAGIQLSQFFGGMETNGIDPKLITLTRPTLEDIFLALTGKRLRD